MSTPTPPTPSPSLADYLASCKRRFGTANPERMRVPVWEWMVRTGNNPYVARRELGGEREDYYPGNPDWCFVRMGKAVVRLPDGRAITIAGEHEDSYDPDFCIYNDVVVRRGDDVEIYGYPEGVFPPTDFHSATLIGSEIWIVGSLGYMGKRAGETQVFVLDTTTYHIRRVHLTGTSPGWIHEHRATLLDDGVTIEISRGEVFTVGANRETCKANTDTFRLDTRSLIWSKTTDTSSWRQFHLKYEQSVDDMLGGDNVAWYTGEILLKLGHRVDFAPEKPDVDEDDPSASDSPHAPENPEPFDFDEPSEPDIHTLWLGDVPVRVHDSYRELRIVIEGAVPEADVQRLVDGLRTLLESTKRRVTEVIEC